MKKKHLNIPLYNPLMRLCLLAFIFVNCNTSLPAQEKSPFKVVASLQEDITLMTTDKLGQLYFYNQKEQLFKLDPAGKKLFEYTNFNLGNLKTIDATDPFNLLLYFSDFGEIVTLNRTLNESSTFNLFELGYQDVNLIAMSNDNNIWIYDPNEYKLKKINRAGDLIIESIPLINELEEIAPNYLLERNNLVYINDPNLGVLVFDPFGKFMKTYSNLKGLNAFQLLDDRIIYQKENKFWSYDLLTAKTKEIKLPFTISKGDRVFIQRNRLYLYNGDMLQIYKY